MPASDARACKVVLVGDGSVGKSSLIARFVDGGFSRAYKQTVGLDWFDKTLALPDGAAMRVQVWDVGGQSGSSRMLEKYVHSSDVVALCYDVTDARSFADAQDWLTRVRAATGPAAQLFLVGNKIDLVQLRQVDETRHEALVRNERLAGGFLVSAQSGDQVLRAFYSMVASARGLALSGFDLALLADRVLEVSVPAALEVGAPQQDEALRRIEEEDRAADAARRKRMAREAAKRRPSCTVM